MKYLVFDTETTGLPKNWAAPISDTENWPRCIQLAWQLHDGMGQLLEHHDFIIKPDNFDIPYDSEKVHGISTQLALTKGTDLQEVLLLFAQTLAQATFVVGQNIGFDINVMACEYYRMGIQTPLTQLPILDTCTEVTADLLKIPGGKGGKFKLPTLSELHEFLFGEPFAEAHNATADVEATTRCFLELIRKEIFTTEELGVSEDYFIQFYKHNPEVIKPIGLKHLNLKTLSEELRNLQVSEVLDVPTLGYEPNDWEALPFVHLHNHSQFTILQSTISVSELVKKTAEYNMPAVALTDYGNLMGAFLFTQEVNNYNAKHKTDIKPIIGCELYICDNHLDKSRKDNGYQVVFLAKNKKGYENLSKMSSIAYTKGFYYVPRIDRKIVEQYKEDLIVLSGNLYGEIPAKILNTGERQAEDALLWWKERFGSDFYLELMRHNQEDENRVNSTLLSFSRKHKVKIVATNNTFYINQEDGNAHDILLCVKEGEKQATPIGRGRGYRFGLPNQEYYFKTPQAMKDLFKDIPNAIANTLEIVEKVEKYSLKREVLLPKFDIPQEFLVFEDEQDGGKRGENSFLKHLTFEGAKKRYPQLTQAITDRLLFELQTIEKTGYPGYFLIVQDFIAKAREMDVSVGPGRGSAAGSAVAYCLGITNIDPIAYDLLFERFLNPDRVSMPDIDIDFDDDGREKVIQYVIDKYGSSQVAQIITYGTMAAKSSIRDTARVLDVALFEADRIAKLIPNQGASLQKMLKWSEADLKKNLRTDDWDKAYEFRKIADGTDLIAETIRQATILEGSVRNTGTHACGVIITPDDITNFVPVSTARDSELFVTQFDNSVVESAGLLKMDFLGLKTLTLIKDTVKLIKYIHGIELDADAIPIDDVKTYELFQRGETVGIFQYESPGMQKYLRELKPTVFADLIAMNALYRPGPLEYIPSFIRRKNGSEPITYDLDACEEYLKETYGITVYQEQVMLLSQKLADFTKGEADVLRKAMGKKQRDTLDKMRPQFISQASAKGHSTDVLEKIWKDWEAFASYAFNKSHSTCYAWIGYQTAYLKAHYPAEYMAAVLSNNMNDIKSVSFFMEEAKRMGLQVLGPDVNESYYKFTVSRGNVIRFGMGAIKGVGSGAVETIIENRKNKKYTSIFDFAKRVDLKAANKKAFDGLALAGGFDCFENTHRAQYFHTEEGQSFLERAIRYGSRYQESQNSSQVSLFGENSEVQIPEPIVPACEPWNTMEKLAREKEVVGIYISGHPLDDFKFELKYFANTSFDILGQLSQNIGKTLNFGGMVTAVNHKIAKNGKGWGSFVLEGYESSFEFRIFGEEYLKFKHFLEINTFIYVRLQIREGWIQSDGSRSEPRMQYNNIMQMQDVLQTFSKKMIISLPITSFDSGFVAQMQKIIKKWRGEHQLLFEVLEIEKVSVAVPTIEDELSDEVLPDENMPEIPEVQDKIVTKLTLPSRKVKIGICPELLEELDKLQVDFRLN